MVNSILWDAIPGKKQFKPAIQGIILLFSTYLTTVKSTMMEWLRKNAKSTKYRKVKTHSAVWEWETGCANGEEI